MIMLQQNKIPNHREEKMTNKELAEIIVNMQSEMRNEITKIHSSQSEMRNEIAKIHSSQLEMKKELESSIAKIQSEVRSRYYDMQNLAYAGHSISDPGYVSTAAAVGRSPRRYINSYDTFH